MRVDASLIHVRFHKDMSLQHLYFLLLFSVYFRLPHPAQNVILDNKICARVGQGRGGFVAPMAPLCTTTGKQQEGEEATAFHDSGTLALLR